jgi:PadR family transcriptional regulator, regulatory protein PadR
MARSDVTVRRAAAARKPPATGETETGEGHRPTSPAGHDDLGGDGLDPGQNNTGQAVATSRDASGAPVHRGWLPVAGHHRWLEPFVLMALAGGSTHGYAIIGVLTDVGTTEAALDVGQVYRTLRDLEQAGQISSTWTTGVGPARRDYTITGLGAVALDEWAAVMKERGRLIAEFDAAYLGWVAARARGG